MTYILGISAYYHDSAAVIIDNGHIVAAAQEERFTRIKQDCRFPTNAVSSVLEEAGIVRWPRNSGAHRLSIRYKRIVYFLNNRH
ncbi:MAG: hypothetical protein LBG58_00605 [Planctomycetaceae bacterium]|jgi:predicted NodU family carbamoyl transferase|nr:hypothetical protein [Planctomycetaceae bacterium]